VLDQHRRQLAVRVVIRDVRGFAPDPGAEVGVLVVHGDFVADGAFPVGCTELGEVEFEEELIYLELERVSMGLSPLCRTWCYPRTAPPRRRLCGSAL